MNTNDIALIEKELGIKLTQAYIDAATKASLANTKFKDFFFDDAKKIISTNKRLREKGMYGKKLLEYHFVVGYRKDGGEYYFIDLLTENGCVYLANRTKGWAYSPDNLSNNDLKIYSSIDEYIKERLFWARRIEESSRNDRPEYTEEEKQKMIADFFADMNKQFPRKK